PRHKLAMKYEAKGVKWKAGPDERIETLRSYHCGYMGCRVRYNPTEVYFTFIDAPEVPTLVEEPGANTLTCPRHGTWLYQGNCDESSHDLWRCGVRRCDYEQVGAASA